MQNSNSSIKPGFWQSAGNNPFWINVVNNSVFWLGMNQKTNDVNFGENGLYVLSLDDLSTLSLEESLSQLTYWINQLAQTNSPFILQLGEFTAGPSSSHQHVETCLLRLATYKHTSEVRAND